MRRRRFLRWLAGLVASAPIAAFAAPKQPAKVVFRLGDKMVVRLTVGEDGKEQEFRVRLTRVYGDANTAHFTLEELDGTFFFVMDEGFLRHAYVRHL
jgi:hypothetical protein